ncbi:SwmB domain-containing protein [Synechococcus sp. MIT S1220]|uniref:SwmB domain-containing protein n=1 Tax=Synechococcus sp. MIT S1220 TaxID=3082549 RepID=UPI0039B05241
MNATQTNLASTLLVADAHCPQIRELLTQSQSPVLWLAADQEPLALISRALSTRRQQGQPVQTMHWVGHGQPGVLLLGGSEINRESLISQQEQLKTWQVDTIALWSCCTGADHAFTSVLEELTGASVWTSDRPLGRLQDGSSSWKLSSSSQKKALADSPEFPIDTSHQLAWKHQLGGFTTNTPTTQASPGRTYQEYRNNTAFAALKDDGSVITWGNGTSGGDSSSVEEELSSGVSQIFGNNYAFAALKDDGSVITWGSKSFGGNSSSVSSSLSSGVSKIFSNFGAFAALKDDGSVITWGSTNEGGDSSSVSSSLSSGVSKIFSNFGAFAALKDDGSVITWGSTNEGGDSSSVSSSLSSGVSQLFSTSSAFAALKDDGSVITWGYTNHGGDSSSVSSSLSSGVSQLFSTSTAFAALKDDGSVITWGYTNEGGDSSSVEEELSSGVSQIFSNNYAFAALKKDGSVITWGSTNEGGDSSAVSSSLSSGVSKIFSNNGVFAALKDDGSAITWGRTNYGGDSSSVSSSLSSGVSKIFSNFGAFAVLKDDGSVITWGNTNYGGDSSSVSSSLSSGVSQLFSTLSAFAALKDDGSVITWGNTNYGGNSSSVSAQLSSGVVGFANPLTNDVYDSAGKSKDDSTAPTVTSSATSTDGSKVVLTYDKKLSAVTAANKDFSVTTDGVPNEVKGVTISGAKVKLALTTPVKKGQNVTVAYTDPSPANDANAIQDRQGNDVESLSKTTVINNSRIDGRPPTFKSASSNAAGNKILLNYDEILSAKTADNNDFIVRSNGAPNNVTSVTILNATIKLNLATSVKKGQAVTVAYTDPSTEDDANAIQDRKGNDATSLSETAVTNNSSLDGTPPRFKTASTNPSGSKVLLNYDEILSAKTADNNDFIVRSNGAPNKATAVNINNATVNLTLTTPIKKGQTVTVAYTDPSTADDANAIQDRKGNDATSLSETAVTNNSSLDGTPPRFKSASTNAAGSKVLLNYDEKLSSKSADNNDFFVRSNGFPNKITAVTISDATVRLSLAKPVKKNQSVTVAYTDPSTADDANAIQDRKGNDATSLNQTAVTNNSIIDGAPPTFKSASTNAAGNKVLLNYDEKLSAKSANNNDFLIRSNGIPNKVTAITIRDATLKLTLAKPVKINQNITVAYTDPSNADDANAIQDKKGNDVASLKRTIVTNNSTIKGKPAAPKENFADFSHKQVKQLSLKDIKRVSKPELSDLSPKAIKGFSTKQIASLSSHVFSGLDQNQLSRLTKDAVTGLKKGHLKTLNGEELSTFKPNVLMEFAPDSISGLKPASLDALNKKQTRAFKNNQLASLSKKQIKKAKDFVDDLTKKQSKALTTGVSKRTMRTFEPLIQSDDESVLLLGIEPLA